MVALDHNLRTWETESSQTSRNPVPNLPGYKGREKKKTSLNLN